jgi:hypothetical protein
MERIVTSTAVPNMFGAGKAGFTNGGGGTLPTRLDSSWFNAVQEEIAETLEGYGLTLNGDVRNQLCGLLQLAFAKIVANWFASGAWTGTVASGDIYAVACNGGIWQAVGHATDGSAFVARSLDGVNWVTQSLVLGSGAGLHAVAWNAQLGQWCVVGGEGATFTSPDGVTWTDQDNPGFVGIGIGLPTRDSTQAGASEWLAQIYREALGPDAEADVFQALRQNSALIAHSPDPDDGTVIGPVDGPVFAESPAPPSKADEDEDDDEDEGKA